jgi:hypothetical protein
MELVDLKSSSEDLAEKLINLLKDGKKVFIQPHNIPDKNY